MVFAQNFSFLGKCGKGRGEGEEEKNEKQTNDLSNRWETPACGAMSGAGEESIYGLIPEAYQPPPKQPLYRSKFPGAWRQWARASARSVLNSRSPAAVESFAAPAAQPEPAARAMRSVQGITWLGMPALARPPRGATELLRS